MSVHRLTRRYGKLTVLFNSLDQLSARFPLCAKQEIFVPGMIEALSGERVTSIFVAVEEPGQPSEQYGLLPMADLALSFRRYRFTYRDYYQHLEEYHERLTNPGEREDFQRKWGFRDEEGKRELNEGAFDEQLKRVEQWYRTQLERREKAEDNRLDVKAHREEVVLQVVRYAGGQKAGARGILELDESGLHFIVLSPRYAQGEPV